MQKEQVREGIQILENLYKQHITSLKNHNIHSKITTMKLVAMDSWWWWWTSALLLLLLLSYALKLLFLPSPPPAKSRALPPGPRSIPVLSAISWFSRNPLDTEHILRRLHAEHGPVFSVRIASTPAIFVTDRSLAHRALVHHGAVFADRPPSNITDRLLSSDRHNVSSAPYGPLWRALRRNLTSEILHPSRIKHFADARNWVLQILIDKLRSQAESENGVVVVIDSFNFAMFCLLVLMCFGEKLDVDQIREIESVQKELHRSFPKLGVFTVFPKITTVLFRKRWRMLLDLRRRQEEIFTPLIRARGVCSYVDSLLGLSIPEDGERRLTEGEIVSLCSEFLSAGTDTTATALEWTMAEVVRNPAVQRKLVEEIESVVSVDEEIKEEDLPKMTYLKAVILEGLRRHPPAHFVVPHVVTEEAEIGGYIVPREASVNFMVAEMGWDEKVWEKPMEFRPERFLAGGEGEGVDITGSREIKMMPFGAGRRICPGLGLAMMHLEYFVANLVREFEWTAVEGEEVNLSEALELTVIMKNHLRARIVPRRENKIVK